MSGGLRINVVHNNSYYENQCGLQKIIVGHNNRTIKCSQLTVGRVYVTISTRKRVFNFTSTHTFWHLNSYILKLEMTIHMIHKCSPNETILNPIQWPKMPRELEVPTTRHRTFNRQPVSRETLDIPQSVEILVFPTPTGYMLTSFKLC